MKAIAKIPSSGDGKGKAHDGADGKKQPDGDTKWEKRNGDEQSDKGPDVGSEMKA